MSSRVPRPIVGIAAVAAGAGGDLIAVPCHPYSDASVAVIGGRRFGWLVDSRSAAVLSVLGTLTMLVGSSSAYGQPPEFASARYLNSRIVGLQGDGSTSKATAAALSSRPVAVRADAQWVDSGIDVSKGDTISLKAQGRWSNGGDTPQYVTPFGFPGSFLPGTLLPSAPLGALIARVGDSAFLVGSGADAPSPAGGRLFLAMNDVADMYADNRGQVQVSVAVTSRSAPLLMPDFVALKTTLDDARAQLVKLHSVPHAVQRGPSSVPAGTIYQQEPAPGTDLREGPPITLYVSEGPASSASVPAVTTTPAADVPDTARAADLSAVMTLNTGPPYARGQGLDYTIVVSNRGPAPATDVRIDTRPTRLQISGVSGACPALPCTIPTIGAGAAATISETAVIDGDGAFDNAVFVVATEMDPAPDDNTDADSNGGFTGEATHDKKGGRDSRRLWPWLLLTAIGLVSVAAAVSAATRESRWRRVITIASSLDLDGDASAGPLSMASPPVSISIKVEIGRATPVGAIPITVRDMR